MWVTIVKIGLAEMRLGGDMVKDSLKKKDD